MSRPIETFRNRFNELLAQKGLLASDVAAKTGISKSTISKYIHGQIEAKQDKIYLIANAYNVDPAWLMGYDVPMERDAVADKLDEYEMEMIKIISGIADEGIKRRLLAYARKMKDIDEAEHEAEES